MLLYTWMNNFTLFARLFPTTLVLSLPHSLAWMTAWHDPAWLALMDVVAWHLGVAWPALLVTELFLSSLSDVSGLVPVTWSGFVLHISFPQAACTCHVWSICRYSLSLTSPGEVRPFFRNCLHDVPGPLFVWVKRPCDWRMSVSSLFTTDIP